MCELVSTGYQLDGKLVSLKKEKKILQNCSYIRTVVWSACTEILMWSTQNAAAPKETTAVRPLASRTIPVRLAIYACPCGRIRDELISEDPPSISTLGNSDSWLANTYIHQLCVDTRCHPMTYEERWLIETDCCCESQVNLFYLPEVLMSKEDQLVRSLTSTYELKCSVTFSLYI